MAYKATWIWRTELTASHLAHANTTHINVFSFLKHFTNRRLHATISQCVHNLWSVKIDPDLADRLMHMAWDFMGPDVLLKIKDALESANETQKVVITIRKRTTLWAMYPSD
ncbi:hypothetical protein Dda_8817 [Drechslerella dactyloides]|uniref:Uncharacterized protein n=1 Tax=Drechslerella dactyloides TaxID=74499 RepID=A0AAD6IQ29_DREDA|nr:hypothetical protein Dda_8817 [Drechslerella dactyloides]